MKRRFAGTFGFGVVLVVAAACSTTSYNNGSGVCAVGEEGCPCTRGGICDSGLSCVSGVCAAAGVAGGAGEGATAGNRSAGSDGRAAAGTAGAFSPKVSGGTSGAGTPSGWGGSEVVVDSGGTVGTPGIGGDPGAGGAAAGLPSTGGQNIGAATGGAATGGAATGGAATGGVATGGVATGGAATGGVATGGVATGGVATGGAATGGSTPTCGNVLLAAGTGVRRISGDTLVLTFGAVKAGTEDRMALEWDLSALALPITQALMRVPLRNIDPEGTHGILDVYVYNGNGQITAADFDAGTTIQTSFIADEDKTYEVDLTSSVRTALANKLRYFGVRLSTTMTDRYWVDEPYELYVCK